MRNNIGLFLAKRAHLNPELEALVEAETERRFSYRDLNERANRFANALLDKGIRKGDRVAFLLRNCAEFVEGFFAVGKIGGVMVPLNSRLVPDELEFILKDSGASVLIFDAEFASAVESLHPRHTSVESWIDVGGESPSVDFAERYDALMDQASAEEPRITTRGEDLFLIVYTSGTTGRPKGAMHTHDSVMWASLTWVMTLDVRALDRFLLFLPPFHVGVLLPLTMLTHRGGTVVMMRTFEPGRVFELVEQEKITTTLAVPTMFHLMLQHPGDPSTRSVDATLEHRGSGAGSRLAHRALCGARYRCAARLWAHRVRCAGNGDQCRGGGGQTRFCRQGVFPHRGAGRRRGKEKTCPSMS